MTAVVHGADLIASILGTDDSTDVATTAPKTSLKFDVDRVDLQKLLDKAITVVPTKDTMPVLKCFYFDVGQRLRIIATDCELSMIVSSGQVRIQRQGVAVFPARKLVDIVKSAADETVSIRVAGTTGHITSGRASWSLKLQSGADFPPMPTLAEVELTTATREPFYKALAAAKYAASRDPNRISLNLIDVRDGKLTACDGGRIQQFTLVDFPLDMQIPSAAVDDILRLLKLSADETMKVGQSANHLLFGFGSDVLIVSKLSAKYPDMEQAILRPALRNQRELTVGRAALQTALRRVRINADPDSSAVAVTASEGKVTVLAKDKHGNEASESIDARWDYDEHTVVVNHLYLASMLSAYGPDTCTFWLGADTKTKRSHVLLRDSAAGSVAVVPQMSTDWSSPK